MTTVQAEIPPALVPDVEAALAWWNTRENVGFEVTGIVDPDNGTANADVRELRLVLCGGDRCEQRTFRVSTADGGREVSLLEEETVPTGAPVAELDPPPGARKRWLDAALERHAFIVLVFYRGFW